MIATKLCTACNNEKPLSHFGRNRSRSTSACKSCEADRMRRYRMLGAGQRASDTGGLTHVEIAERLGVSRTLVQQIEARALKKLRRAAAEIMQCDEHELPTHLPERSSSIVVQALRAGGWR